MSERSELRSRREERMENGVKNLKGARLFTKPFLITEMEMLRPKAPVLAYEGK